MYWNDTIRSNPFLVSPTNDLFFDVYGLDANGCSTDTLDVELNLHEPLNLSVVPNVTICLNDTATIQVFTTGGLQPYSYNWSNGLSDSSFHNVSPLSTTTYTVNVSDDCETPLQNDAVTVFVNPLPVVDFNFDISSGCYPLTVNFTDVSYDPNNLGISWDFDIDDSSSFLSSVDSSVSYTYSSPGNYGVSLSIINSFGCTDTAFYANVIEVHDYHAVQLVLKVVIMLILAHQVLWQ